jgi:hypothetical protein
VVTKRKNFTWRNLPCQHTMSYMETPDGFEGGALHFLLQRRRAEFDATVATWHAKRLARVQLEMSIAAARMFARGEFGDHPLTCWGPGFHFVSRCPHAEQLEKLEKELEEMGPLPPEPVLFSKGERIVIGAIAVMPVGLLLAIVFG